MKRIVTPTPKQPEPRTVVIRVKKKTLDAIAAAGRPYGFSAQRSFDMFLSDALNVGYESPVENVAKGRIERAIQRIIEATKSPDNQGAGKDE